MEKYYTIIKLLYVSHDNIYIKNNISLISLDALSLLPFQISPNVYKLFKKV